MLKNLNTRKGFTSDPMVRFKINQDQPEEGNREKLRTIYTRYTSQMQTYTQHRTYNYKSKVCYTSFLITCFFLKIFFSKLIHARPTFMVFLVKNLN